ncbi:MAG TPA: copper resistance CopC family protein [Burkholderiales bacterium]|nr:copper resistance CopC family protein [Burkholderiales bacterium]
MRIPTLPLALAACLVVEAAQAHAHLEKSTPADGSTLAAAPATLELTFSEPARLTALSIRRDEGAEQAVRVLPTAAERTQRVALPALAAGTYTFTWRVLAADGHVSSGVVRFTIAASAR